MNLLRICDELLARYRRYLSSTFQFQDPEFRDAFEKALQSEYLARGPFLEVTPPFVRGSRLRDVAQELLGGEVDAGFLNGLEGGRPFYLYAHQEEAIRKIWQGRNVVVATGTGSGKTEAFLIPILLHLYQQHRRGILGAGVRALILYPMNALANDQRERLSEMVRAFTEAKSEFGFNFGQYTGETPEDETTARGIISNSRPSSTTSFGKNGIPHGELISRNQMRHTPPHILLTNYSMLEYLLIRPYDSPLFDGEFARFWTFLVVDEVHQYRGTRGAEMSMLLRRLKHRIRESCPKAQFRCIATSASIAAGKEACADVARFVSELFDEPFEAEDVILGQCEPIPTPGPVRLEAMDYNRLEAWFFDKAGSDEEVPRQLARKLEVDPAKLNSLSPAERLGVLLHHDGRAGQLRQIAVRCPQEVDDLVSQVFPEFQDGRREEGRAALVQLVRLLMAAVNPSTKAPLLSARFHLFLRALEGAYISFYPEKRLFLCKTTHREDGAVFEVAVCRECGQHYLVGKRDKVSERFSEAVRDPTNQDFGITYVYICEGDAEGPPADSEEGFEEPLEDTERSSNSFGEEADKAKDLAGRQRNQWKTGILCGKCGKLVREGKFVCDCPQVARRRVKIFDVSLDTVADPHTQRGWCLACGSVGSHSEPVREFVHGSDGPNAVIATALFELLPERRRKVLAFADNRQEAAFFSWYLDRSFEEIFSRNLLFKGLASLGEKSHFNLSLKTLADACLSHFRHQWHKSSSDDEIQPAKNVWIAIYRELLGAPRRISLSSVGLIRWSAELPHWLHKPDSLGSFSWQFTDEEWKTLLRVFYLLLVHHGAIRLLTDGVPISWEDLGFRGKGVWYALGKALGDKTTRCLDGPKSPFVDYFSRVARRASTLSRIKESAPFDEEQAIAASLDLVRSLVEYIAEQETNVGPAEAWLPISPKGIQANPSWVRVSLLKADDKLYRCRVCGSVQGHSLFGVCLRKGCPGFLEQLSAGELEENHYRWMYQTELPGRMRVEEHTAQLTPEVARKFQDAFRRGFIHVLSCSTTFELGVDLGDLDVIFLRNVPPEPFNYAQRTGRSGRRPGFPGLVVTFCNRKAHDIFHFYHPERMLSGQTAAPVLRVQSARLVLRHMTAYVLSKYFRKNPDKFGKVINFFENLPEVRAAGEVRHFCRCLKHKLVPGLKTIVPAQLHAQVGLTNDQWVDLIAGESHIGHLRVRNLLHVESALASDYRQLCEFEKQQARKEAYQLAQWAKKRRKTLEETDILSFLSRTGVIPKYGFPVDVVELDLGPGNGDDIELTRDLSQAISEFAPGMRVIANKKEYTSIGLKTVPEKSWPIWWYEKETEKDTFRRESLASESRGLSTAAKAKGKYIEPIFGFIADGKPREPSGRPWRLFSSRVYFVGFCSKSGDSGNGISVERRDFGSVQVVGVSPGYLVNICEGLLGAGFWICTRCGAGVPKRVTKHTTPWGQNCRETLSPFSLGHEFISDVLCLQFTAPVITAAEEARWLAQGLASALLEAAADLLEVPTTDLGVTVSRIEPFARLYPLPAVVLYDNVPGGAGLVAELQHLEKLEELLRLACERVNGSCGCDPETSCYGCLRSYRNQFAHHMLRRGPTEAYLKQVLGTLKKVEGAGSAQPATSMH